MKTEEVIETIIKDGWFVYKNEEYKVDLVERKQDDWQLLEVDNLPGDIKQKGVYKFKYVHKYIDWVTEGIITNVTYLDEYKPIDSKIFPSLTIFYRKRKPKPPTDEELAEEYTKGKVVLMPFTPDKLDELLRNAFLAGRKSATPPEAK